MLQADFAFWQNTFICKQLPLKLFSYLLFHTFEFILFIISLDKWNKWINLYVCAYAFDMFYISPKRFLWGRKISWQHAAMLVDFHKLWLPGAFSYILRNKISRGRVEKTRHLYVFVRCKRRTKNEEVKLWFGIEKYFNQLKRRRYFMQPFPFIA